MEKPLLRSLKTGMFRRYSPNGATSLLCLSMLLSIIDNLDNLDNLYVKIN